jgi:glucose-1-phosphate thymidylyltransferase
MNRKGIILAGGSGTRLYPATEALSKQLVPIFDKPMIYYPLSILFLANIREIAIISSPTQLPLFKSLLGDGSKFGAEFQYIVQPSPDGLAQAYVLAEDFLNGSSSAMALGDNIFFGHSLPTMLNQACAEKDYSTVFCSQVHDPERYGIIELDEAHSILSIEEKPIEPKSNYAVTGLYFLDSDAVEIAKSVPRSQRGEYEITSVLEHYILHKKLHAKIMKRGFAWFDTGTHNSLLRASNFVETMQSQQGLMIACLEEIAHNNGWISQDILANSARKYAKSHYGAYLNALLK